MADAELKQLIRKRGAIKHKMTSFSTFLEPINANFEQNIAIEEKVIFELQLRTDKFENISQEFEEIQLGIEIICSDVDLNNHYKERDDFMASYAKYLAVARYILSKISPVENDNDNLSESSSNHSKHSNRMPNVSNDLRNIKLPTISLPKFNADFNSWLEFKDTFESLIHNNQTINDIQKYHYLRASLGDDAQKIIQSLEFSSKNYKTAWDLLCNRFDNSRLLVNNHIASLFNIESLVKESASGLRNLIDSVNKHLRALKSLDQPTEHWDTLIVYIISSKLDKATAREWEKHKVEQNLPKLSDLQTFLRNRADFLETLNVNHTIKDIKEKDTRRNIRHTSLLSSNTENKKCNFCNQPHLIYACERFLKLTIPSRWEKIKELKLCSNCLCKGHINKICRFGSCKKCKRKHSTLLHQDQSQTNSEQDYSNNKDSVLPCSSSHVLLSQKETSLNNLTSVSFASEPTSVTNESQQLVTLSNQSCCNYVLLSTATIYVHDSQGKALKVKAILDSGSQSCFISEHLCKRLQLKTSDVNISILGINSVTSNLRKQCNVSIKSIYNGVSYTMTCFVLPKVTANLPMYTLDIASWNIPENIQLADPTFNVSGPVDLLVGASLFWNLLTDGRINLGKNMPILQNTVFGYIISGQIPYPISKVQCYFTSTEMLCNDLKKFWEIEESKVNPELTDDDWLCENHFMTNTMRDESGKFIVRIPIKSNISELGDSKTLAIKRLLQLERRFQIDEKFKCKYISFMDEYQELNHMTELRNVEIPDSEVSYFLPHHGVIREESLTTKLRVVFDGSAVTDSGRSLNDIQFIGPSIQNDIIAILLRFRQHNIVVTSDIAKMYRQILVHPQDRHLQRIVWRDDPSKDISVFELNTVTYGTANAPYLAIRCIKQLATDNQEKFPTSSQIILHDIYVDDLITGFESEDQAIHFSKEIAEILQSASFSLRKWASNNSTVLHELQDQSDSMSILSLGDNEQIKTLGIQWLSKSDTLSYKIANFPQTTTATKRIILSIISKIFDPLGLVSPCIIMAKIILQRLWTLKLGWDDEVPSDIEKRWRHFQKKLPMLNNLKIPRHAICQNPKDVELHGFCDASQQAYSAVIYLRSIDAQQNIQVSLLCSKTKVAPIKSLTIPRLELCGSLLLARLAKEVSSSLTCRLKFFFWCDSQIVLYWLNTQSTLLNIFVGNRVSEIQRLTDIKNWNYISSKENPADLASRGIFPDELIQCSSWWTGPPFLSCLSEWPKSLSLSFSKQIPELRKQCSALTVTNSQSLSFNFDTFSNLTKLVRVHAYCLRFISNLKKQKQSRQTGHLTVYELESSMLNLVKIAQHDNFSNEITILQSKTNLKSKHKLVTLNPFLDSDGLLRVGGRLKYSSLHYDTKHPLLLDGKHKLSELIFKYEHIRLCHAGPQLLLFSVRQKYWPTSGMNVAKKTTRHCIQCFKIKPKSINSIMADLPKDRVTCMNPFYISGVDYAGPFFLKDRQGRGFKLFKGYICLFICFTSKAIHLELVTDLTTEAFISALRRFTSRRGRPGHIYSDNAKNFVSAVKHLNTLNEFLVNSKDEIVKYCANENIIWHFIPPNSPHFGGLWESGVKSVKHHLYRVIKDTKLTYEEFYTILVQIESILNSRPIHPLSSDPNDLQPLTPSHFLIGKPLTTVPDPHVLDIPINKLSRYQLLQQINQSFWHKWSSQYLTTLQGRAKWKQETSNLKIDTLVLIKHDNLPPCNWLLGRIIELHPGDDGVVRVATIRTKNGTLRRAITRLCPLPLPETN